MAQEEIFTGFEGGSGPSGSSDSSSGGSLADFNWNRVWDNASNLLGRVAPTYFSSRAASTAAPSGNLNPGGSNPLPGLFGYYPQAQTKPITSSGGTSDILSAVTSGGAMSVVILIVIAVVVMRVFRG